MAPSPDRSAPCLVAVGAEDCAMKRPESRRKINQEARDSDGKIWRDWNEINPWLFPLPSVLARDPGQIGQILQGLPEELLRDADRCPNPWRELSNNRFLTVGGYPELFCACASVLSAAIQLVRKVYARGDLIERAKQARTKLEFEAVNRMLFPGMWRSGAGLLLDAATQKGPNMLSQFEEHEARLLKMIAKQHGKLVTAARADKPTADSLRKKWPLLYLMLTNWLRCGHRGDPGFMFYSDPALTDLFSLLNWEGFKVTAEDLDSEQIEQMRGRLGLRKANEKLPLITGARMNRTGAYIQLNTQDAKIAKCEWPKTPLQLTCRIQLNGRVLYSGVPS